MIQVDTDCADAVLHRLTSWAVDHEIELEGLEVTRPSLEDVYLPLTAEDRPVKNRSDRRERALVPAARVLA